MAGKHHVAGAEPCDYHLAPARFGVVLPVLEFPADLPKVHGAWRTPEMTDCQPVVALHRFIDTCTGWSDHEESWDVTLGPYPPDPFRYDVQALFCISRRQIADIWNDDDLWEMKVGS